MAPTYKLHYFNVTALGEPSRYLLAYGKAKWEDVRYEEEEWPQVKPKMLFGKMPVLEIDGKPFAQSSAMARYLGKQFGLVGKDDLENLQIDMTVNLHSDLLADIGSWAYDPNPDSKASKKGPLYEEQIPFYLSKFEEMVKANGGYLVGGKLTWADIYFVAPLKYYNALVAKNMLEGYPGLQSLVRKVESVPAISGYIAQRPTNPENK